jgi:integrase
VSKSFLESAVDLDADGVDEDSFRVPAALQLVDDRCRTFALLSGGEPAVPAFSPHDLRHRRISLLHLAGVPWATIGQHVGQRDIATTANTYSHVLSDETELDYERLLGW